jgi:hypothetical protein
MNRPRQSRVSRRRGASPRRQRLCPPAAALLLLLGTPALPALAQATGDGQTAPSVPAAAPATSAGPSALPWLPESGFGAASPVQSPNAAPNAAAPAPQPPSLSLPAPGAGILPLQRGQPGAPAVLIQPWVSIGETVTDNVRNTATDHVWDLETQPMPGLWISADTPRLVGVLTGNLAYDRYIVATDEDQLYGNLYASGTAAAIPDHLYLDVTSAVSQAATFGAAGFAPISQLSTNQITQIYTNTASPYFRYSYGGLVDAELRYRVASAIFGANTLAGAPPPSPFVPGVTPITSALSNSLSNDGTLIIATGSNFERLLSRLTIDTSELTAAPGSVIPNAQVSAYDDVEYRFTPEVAALARLGYENIRYPFAPAATATGILWQVGGRLGLGPDNQYLILRYGEQQGIYGVTGSLYYEITPVTVLTAAATQGVGSTQQQVGSNLAQSRLDIYGQMIDQYNLPTSFANPQFALENDVYRSYLYRAGITTDVGINRFSLFGIYNRQVSLALVQLPTTSFGANFAWTRSIRPHLTAFASIGYAKTINQPLLSSTGTLTAANIPGQNAVNASFSLGYLIARNLTGSIVYTLLYQTNAQSSLGAAISGNVVTNRLEFLLTETF